VQLSSLSVAGFEEAIDEMFCYLRSYSGLKKLRIPRIQMEQQTAEDTAGNIFWHEVVPQHKDSLTKLAVEPVYEGAWCYGPAASRAIQQCASLQKLALGVCEVDPAWAGSRIAQLLENNTVGMPELEQTCENSKRCLVCSSTALGSLANLHDRC
jgi:hypothetical protein